MEDADNDKRTSLLHHKFYRVGSTLPANIRLDWKWVEVASTLAYYGTATIAAVKLLKV